MAMGHVILKEFFVDRQTPYFADYVKRYTDLPFLVTLEPSDGDALPCRASSSPPPTCRRAADGENAAFKTVLIDAAHRRAGRAERLARAPLRRAEGVGRWNLDLGDVDPRLSADAAAGGGRGRGRAAALRHARRRRRRSLRAASRSGGSAGHLVTTVFDLLLAQYGVGRDGLPGTWPTGYDDADPPYTPAWQEAITGVPGRAGGADRARVRRATPRSPAAAR